MNLGCGLNSGWVRAQGMDAYIACRGGHIMEGLENRWPAMVQEEFAFAIE